jgi:hypothetical protein
MARWLRAALGMLLTLVLAGCGSQSVLPTYPSYKFTCCEGNELRQVWHPGQTVELRWSVAAGPLTSDTTEYPVVLSTALSGPFADVSSLKKAAVPFGPIAGPEVKTTNRTAVAPVMSFTLPPDLPAGFYNLTIKQDFGGGNWWSSGSIVQVSPSAQ